MKSILLLISFSTARFPNLNSLQEVKDYICVSGTAYVYHQKKRCKGLSNFTHTIKAVSEQEAKAGYK